MTPPPIPEHIRSNFDTLTRAFEHDAVVLMSAIRAADQQPVTLVCAVQRDGESFEFIPFAEMINGNPFELYEDPTT